MDKVSIIMPTYRRNDFLKRAIESILAQTYNNIELIVVDDNGNLPDARRNVRNTLLKYASDPRIKHLENEKNLGGALSRNRGIEAATGEFITFLDDDDEYLPEKVETQYTFMTERSLDVCIMDGATYDIDGNLVGEKHQVFPKEPTYESLMVAHMLHHLTGTNTIMFRAESIRMIGGFSDVPAGHEYFLMEKAIAAHLTIGYLPLILVRNCTHNFGRISVGAGKIEAQKLLLSAKKKHFDLLSTKQKRFIYCKHYGGVFFIHFVNRQYFPAAWNLLCAVVCSPKGAFEIFTEKKGRLQKSRSITK